MQSAKRRPAREFITNVELPRFTRTPTEDRLIGRIAARAMVDLAAARHHDKFTKQDIHMDVTATHANGNPLDLRRLLAADDFNFAHDILGIRRHLDRSTGGLLNCFSPRFSKRTA